MLRALQWRLSQAGKKLLVEEALPPVVGGRVFRPKSTVIRPTGNDQGAAVGAKESGY